jgi:hypothetical protein
MTRIITVMSFALLMAIASTFGLAADQGVNVLIPARAMIIIWPDDITINMPRIDTWPSGSETYTQSSREFTIVTALNTLGNSDMVVTASPLQHQNGSATIPLSGFKVNLENLSILGPNVTVTESLDKVVRLKNIGMGLQLTTGYYDLTVNADQEAGRYQGTVTYTLINR